MPIKNTTNAVVLVVEERCCENCEHVSRSPAGLFIRISNGGVRFKQLYRYSHEVLTRSFLVHEKKVVSSSIAACENCFPAIDEHQLPLFPELFGPRTLVDSITLIPVIEAREAKRTGKPKVKAFQLSDF